MTKNGISVYNHEGEYLGEAKGFSEAKRMHRNALQEAGRQDLLDNYIGVDCTQDFFGEPQFLANV